MANKFRLPRGTKSRIETVAETLLNYEIVYSIDTNELGVKNNDGTITYFGVVTELEWANILNKPTFADVATTGSYNDLSGKPDLTEKLDKDFSALPNQESPLLTDVLAINRGTVVQKTTLGNLLAQVDAEIFVVVTELPASGLANKIYLVPKASPDLNDGYNEYIWKDNDWELLGSLTLDLSNYYNKSEVNGLLEAKVDANNPIVDGTHPKITYDAKGLVTGGADLVATDIPQLAPSKITQDANNRFVTDTEKSTWNEKQNALTAGDGISIVGDVISATGGGSGGGYEPDGETITLNNDDELEATNVAIWRYV